LAESISEKLKEEFEAAKRIFEQDRTQATAQLHEKDQKILELEKSLQKEQSEVMSAHVSLS
jgi:ABC-type Zn uptake system ZnuABC Zn-binding protein ZnuA